MAQIIKVWGLTGGIAAGKSTVAQLFINQGIPVIDVDKLVAFCRLREGSQIKELMGTDDPSELGKIIFSDPDQRKRLEDFIRPIVQADLTKILNMTQARFAIVECALFAKGKLLEPIPEGQCVCVLTDLETRINRLMTRNGISRDYALQIIASQPSDEERLATSSIVITNNNIQDELFGQVRDAIRRL